MHAIELSWMCGLCVAWFGVLTCAAPILPELSVFSWSVVADVVMLVFLLLSVVCEKYRQFSVVLCWASSKGSVLLLLAGPVCLPVSGVTLLRRHWCAPHACVWVCGSVQGLTSDVTACQMSVTDSSRSLSKKTERYTQNKHPLHPSTVHHSTRWRV